MSANESNSKKSHHHRPAVLKDPTSVPALPHAAKTPAAAVTPSSGDGNDGPHRPFLGALLSLLQVLYSVEGVEHCYLTFEVSLFGFAVVHLLVQEFNLHKTNWYHWEYTGLMISLIALMRRLLLKVVQSAKMHQDAQEELWARRLMDAQSTPTVGGATGNGSVTPTEGSGGLGGAATGKHGKKQIPNKIQETSEKAPAVLQIRAMTQRRQVMEAKSKRRLMFMGTCLLVLYFVGGLCVVSLALTRPVPALAAIIPILLYCIFLRRARNWGETTPTSPTTLAVLGVVIRRQLICTLYTALAITYYSTVLPVMLVSPYGYYSVRRCEYTALAVFTNSLVLLLAQSLYKGVPMYANARLHDSLQRSSLEGGMSEAGPAANLDSMPQLDSRLLSYVCARPDGLHRTLVLIQLFLIAVQTYVCMHSIAWHTHLVMLLGSYVVLHHCQQCRHDLISSPIMNALLNHSVYGVESNAAPQSKVNIVPQQPQS